MSRLLQLPDELIEHTLSFIDSPADIVSLSQVSRRLYIIATPHRYRTLVIAFPENCDNLLWDTEGAFSRISEPWHRHLRHLEFSSYHPDDPFGPWHLRVPRVRGLENMQDQGFTIAYLERTRQERLNLYLQELIRRIPRGQLQTLALYLIAMGGFEMPVQAETLKCISTTQNNLTKLNMVIDEDVTTNCTVFNLPHLRSLGFWSRDLNDQTQYHAIFSLLFHCQNTLTTFFCHSVNHFTSFRHPEHSQMLRQGFNQWKACTKCCQLGPESYETKTIVLRKLEAWLLQNVADCFINMFYETGIVAGAPVQSFKLTSGTDFLSMKSDKASLNINALLPRMFQQPGDGSVLGSHLMTFRGLANFTFRSLHNTLFERSWGIWFDGLKAHAASLRQLHVSLRNALISPTRLANLGMSCRNLEFVTLEMLDRLPYGILDKTFFPSLKYFHNSAPVKPLIQGYDLEEQEELQVLLDSTISDESSHGVLSDSLLIIAFGIRTVTRREGVRDGYPFLFERDHLEVPPIDGVTREGTESGGAPVRARPMTRREFTDMMEELNGGHVDLYNVATLVRADW